ncbi:MAG: hypothetical protein IPK82_29505 [Polyangiaceae bacterium]|nr:hypothetical protein [Polyangiaceae bacterium]
MRTLHLLATFAAGGIAVLGTGCSNDATFYYEDSLSEVTLSLSHPDEGIHPSQAALSNPDNPFAEANVGTETKWQIQSGAGPIAAFYVWETVLAHQPGGEAQFYVGKNLAAAFLSGDARVEDPPAIKDQAIRAYQTVLDEFPDSVTYDASGTIAYDLATPSYVGIVALGGTVEGGWILVTKEDGQLRAVKP